MRSAGVLQAMLLLGLFGCVTAEPIPDAGSLSSPDAVQRVLAERFFPDPYGVLEGSARIAGRGSVRFLLLYDRTQEALRMELSPHLGDPIGVLVIRAARWVWKDEGGARSGEGLSGSNPASWRRSSDGQWIREQGDAILEIEERTGLPTRFVWAAGSITFSSYRAAGSGYLPGIVAGEMKSPEALRFELKVHRARFPPRPFPAAAFEWPEAPRE